MSVTALIRRSAGFRTDLTKPSFASFSTLRVAPGWEIPSASASSPIVRLPASVQGADGREQAGGQVDALGACKLLHLGLQPLAEALEPAAQGQIAAVLHEVADHVRLQSHKELI